MSWPHVYIEEPIGEPEACVLKKWGVIVFELWRALRLEKSKMATLLSIFKMIAATDFLSVAGMRFKF